MIDIGSQLRQAREARGLSLEQAQKVTRIKRVFLEAIESDRFDELPGRVQVRGFVRSYANYLGIDPDNLLAQMDVPSNGVGYTARPQAGSSGASRSETARVRSMALPSSAPTADRNPSLPLPLPILIIGAIVLFVVGGLLLIQAFAGEAPAPTPTLPPNVPASISSAAESTPFAVAATGVSVTLTAGEHVWVRVSNDGFTAFEGILTPDEARSWQAEQQVIVETGNGAALNVAVNGRGIGVLGPRNRIVIRAWGPEGEVTPAPTAVPTSAAPATVEPTVALTP